MTGAPTSPAAEVRDVATAHGPARVHLHRPAGRPRGLLVLGHGAGGGVEAPDLVAVTEVALAAGLTVALVEQPYRVAGRRLPPRTQVVDEAWTTVVDSLAEERAAAPVLLVGGRSSGARIACRTADALAADGVLCLAFPLRPPARLERPDRLPDLEAPSVPVLVVQGRSDQFGVPEAAPGREVVIVEGDHSLRKGIEGVRAAVGPWLDARLDAPLSGQG